MDYNIVGESSLDWLFFDPENRVIELAIDFESSFSGSSVTVKIEATYANMLQEMSFAVSFISGEGG